MLLHLHVAGPSIGPSNIDSARQNLAASFVNGFVNSGFGQDKLLKEEENKWFYKNKEHGKWLPAYICVLKKQSTILET